MFRTFYGRFACGAARVLFHVVLPNAGSPFSACRKMPIQETHNLQAGNGRINKSNAMATWAWD